LLCSFLFASLNNVTNSSVDVNGTTYSCSAFSLNPFNDADLGVFNTLTLGGICNSYDNSGVESKLYYRFDGITWLNFSLNSEFAQSGYDTWTNSGRDPTIDISALSDGACTLHVYFTVCTVIFPAMCSADRTPSSPYVAYFTKGVAVTFTNGSSFTPSVTTGSSDQAIGRFQLTGAESGASLTDASIKLNGTRTGLSNIKLWASTDATFGSDIQLGLTVSTDPGNGESATFSSLGSDITTSETYYFITADIASDATGNVQGVIVQNSNLTFNSSGVLEGTIDNVVLSGSEVPTPITLASFTAEAKNGVVVLTWETAIETENAHFLIYCNNEVIATIAGAGTTSEPHNYYYKDVAVKAGEVYEYQLADVTWGGKITKHNPITVEMNADIAEANFVLEAAYPNPFNPRTVISYQLSAISHLNANIFNTQGTLIEELINTEMSAGTHQLTWDASGMPSGVYIVTMHVGNTVQSQKIVLMK
jgi:hypothetical protein